jgi:hypothetical protein
MALTSVLDIAAGIVLGGAILGMLHFALTLTVEAYRSNTKQVAVGGGLLVILTVAAALLVVFHNGLPG